jgi:hypothetical protein
MPAECQVCRHDAFTVDVAAAQIDQESALRESFVNQRLGHSPQDPESMDLTRFMHAGPARLLRCLSCGPMRHLYPRYLRALEQKKPLYRRMLRDGAEVLEVGSHLGAFLQTAEDWGWRPTGLGVGQSTSGLPRASRFEPVSPYSRMPPQIRQEWLEVRREGENSPGLEVPWIEVVSRRSETS